MDIYVEMRRLEMRGEPFLKKSYYEALASRFGRSIKSYEYRMQNISYIYSLQGRRWVSGLKPARNVGTNVIRILEQLIADREQQKYGADAEFEAVVEKIRRNPPVLPPKGKKNPQSVLSSVTQFFRDPDIAAWVLAQAEGRCECCDAPAPFFRDNGSPFLEVHHVQRLADGGEDTINNTVALCPNCHRELHYGLEKKNLANKLIKKVDRLR